MRQTKEIDEVVRRINTLARNDVAIAYHSGLVDRPALDRINTSPVVVITHAAYFDAQARRLAGKIERLHVSAWKNYHHGERNLRIIDEAPALVGHHQVTVQHLGILHGAIRKIASTGLSGDVEKLDRLIRCFELDGSTTSNPERSLSQGEMEFLHGIDFAGLSFEFRLYEPGYFKLYGDEESTGSREKRAYAGTLDALAQLQRIGTAWLRQQGKHITINAAENLLDMDRGGVILDATAPVDGTYSILPDRFSLVPSAGNARRYDNVTLHVARGHRVGKNFLSEKMGEHWPSIANSLHEKLSSRGRLLVCCHKKAEEPIKKQVLPLAAFDVAHFGDIDGRNDWQDYDSVAILGLPYLDKIIPANTIMALRDGQPAGCLLDTDTRTGFGNSFIATRVVQAINRVRCRRSVDAAGHCAPVNAFLLLPDGVVGENVVVALRSQMPGIRILAWDIEVERRKKRTVPRSDILLAYLRNCSPGQYTKQMLIDAACMSHSSVNRFASNARRGMNSDAAALAKIGVSYVSQLGRGAESYFLKA